MSATINEKKPRWKNKVGGKIRSANRGMVGYEGKRAKQRRKKYVKQLEKCNESCWGFFWGGQGLFILVSVLCLSWSSLALVLDWLMGLTWSEKQPSGKYCVNRLNNSCLLLCP